MTGQDLKTERLKLGASQADLAKWLNVTVRTISRWETSNRVSELTRLSMMELRGDKSRWDREQGKLSADAGK